MKKFLSALLTLCMLLTACLTLTSCKHECEFAAEWSKDADSHWHVCTGEDCEEIADKAAHTWNEGVLTTKATQEADGVKTFTCTVCEQTKTEAVAYTGMTEAEWNAALSPSVFENFAYIEYSSTKGNGVTVETELIYRFTKKTAWMKITVGDESDESYAPDTTTAQAVHEQLVDSILAMTPYEKFEYDAQTKTYKATAKIEIEALDTSTSDVTLTFTDGKLSMMEYSASFVQNSIKFTATSCVTCTEYGEIGTN